MRTRRTRRVVRMRILVVSIVLLVGLSAALAIALITDMRNNAALVDYDGEQKRPPDAVDDTPGGAPGGAYDGSEDDTSAVNDEEKDNQETGPGAEREADEPEQEETVSTDDGDNGYNGQDGQNGQSGQNGPDGQDEHADSGGVDAVDEQDQEYRELPVIKDGHDLFAPVSKETTLRSDFVPRDLVWIPGYMNPSYAMQVRQEAFPMLEQLWRAAEADGVILSIRSAYRSYSVQKGLFRDYAQRYGEAEANRFSARPGQSEHQLGTAIDFGGTAVDFKAAFGQTPQGMWLAENAHRYGFALSYPEGKEHVTGYIFEPWHYRYIGVEAAWRWKESGLTLKEFLETDAAAQRQWEVLF